MSTTTPLATITSSVKGHHEYQYSYKVGEKFRCHLQPNNVFSEHAIIVKSYSNKTIGHIPDVLAQLLSTLVKDSKIMQIYGVITGHERAAPEGTWTQGGIALPCKYKIYGRENCKDMVQNLLKE